MTPASNGLPPSAMKKEESAAQTASASSNGDADAKKLPVAAMDHPDDISESSHASTPSGGGKNKNGKGDAELSAAEMANQELRSLYFSRIIVATLFLAGTAAAAAVAYLLTTKEEEKDFEHHYDDLAGQVLASAQVALMNVFGLLASVSTSTTALAMTSRNGTTTTQLPYYTVPNFEAFGLSYLDATDSQLLSWSPILTTREEKEEWIAYSTANEAWIEQGLEWRASQDPTFTMPQDVSFSVPNQIYRRNADGEAQAETGSAPYVPVWQMAGAPVDSWAINYNLLSDPVFAQAFAAIAPYTTSSETTTTTTALYDQSFSNLVDASRLYLDSVQTWSPQNLAMIPLYASNTDTNQDVVGVMVSVLSWDMYFTNAISQDEDDTKNQTVYAVVDNGSCGTVFTYQIEGTGQATFLGYQDLHNTDYDSYDISMDFATSTTSEFYSPCTWTITVYPTAGLADSFMTNVPVLWTVFIGVIFLFTGIVFFVYDVFVQKRQIKAMSSAAKNNAIVSSLFPAEVRDRLFGNPNAKSGKGGDANNNNQMPDSSKFRLKHYLSEDDMKEGGLTEDELDSENGGVSSSNVVVPQIEGLDMHETKPIADLFPNTTVMFADIAGFTAWSSVREPSQVFTLLETVYRAFDGIAKRRRVFKVETVGDCYVAVAGLPEPRKDHAVVMAKFARECLDKFNSLAKQLEITLGPDTADLAMRAGLHSGPVTAGVLRGDKSRFQLFGDTVNTAARVEHTGQRNRVHLSSDTAQLLIDAGKEHWVRKRADIVTAKGKGDMQTFWLQSPGDNQEEETEEKVTEPGQRLKDLSLDQLEAALPPKIQRLVGWNVEILKKLMQHIIAQRNARGNKRNYDYKISQMEVEYTKRKYCLDEVTEIIALPKFDVKAHKNQENPNKIEIPKEVVDQLRLYVSSVAAMHREGNPFHNFEHASHVTMSVSKLLARIVAPDEVMNQEEGDNIAASLHDHTYGITSDPLTQFGCVLSALIHDTDHMGVSNFQLIKEDHKIASFFKNKSVAEQNSIVLAWEKLMSPRFADLRKCIYQEPSELDRFRQLVVNNVLATDIFDKELQALRKNRWDKAFQRFQETGASPDEDVNRKATVVMEHLIQASDVAHTMQHWHIYQKWNERLFAEMTLAYEQGRMGFNPADGWYQGELGFFDNYIIPLAKKLKECGVFGVSSDEYLNYALENRREWAGKGEDVVKRYIEKYCKKQDEPKEEGQSGDKQT